MLRIGLQQHPGTETWRLGRSRWRMVGRYCKVYIAIRTVVGFVGFSLVFGFNFLGFGGGGRDSENRRVR